MSSSTLTPPPPPPGYAPPPPPSPPEAAGPPTRHAAPRAPLSMPRVILSVVAGTLALLLLWCVGYISVFSGMQHARAQHRLYATFRNQVANGVAPLGGAINTGSGVALLHAGAAGIGSEMVVEGTSSAETRSGPGHLADTPLPGQAGISIIYGRSLAFGAPFAHLGQLKAGDPISVTTAQGHFTYVVIDVRQAGDVIPSVLSQVPSALILTTRAGGWGSGHIVYVDARLTSKPVVAPSGRPTSVPPQDTPNAGTSDQLTLVQLVLWLQLLVVLACLIGWLQARWGRWQLWLAATPVLLATLWGVSNTAVLLLPNLL